MDITLICSSIFKSLEQKAKRNRVTPILGKIDGPTEIIGDASAIRTILFNIISNAIKFNVPEGKVEVSITTSEDETLISIIDNGIGISKDKLEFLGRHFFREDNAYNSTMDGGLGLGLALAFNIAKGLGVNIDIQSELGKGTAVQVSIPMG
jgi:signal transduction histidine kinase